MSLASYGVRNPVVANLVMITILLGGLIFGLGLRREFFPETRPNQVTVAAPYPGAAPDEVEQALARKIEDRLADLDDVKEITSVVTEGLASITIEFEPGVSIDRAVSEVKREVDALQDLPEDAERIVVDKLEPNIPVIVLSLVSDSDERERKLAVRRIRDDLEQLEGMGDIAISGLRADEIRVEVEPAAMLEHGLSLPDISSTIRQWMRELPGGTVRSSTANYGVRTLGTDERGAQVAGIVLKNAPDGRPITVGEVATIRDTFADVDVIERLNGAPSVSLTVVKVGEQDAVEIADMVKAYVAGLRGEELAPNWRERVASLFKRPGDDTPVSERIRAYQLGLARSQTTPVPGEIVLTTDLARFIVGRLELLSRNAAMGGLLVFATLFLLLSWRTSFWVAIGLVVSLAGTLALMYLLGVTLNLLTMFGLIIVIGLLVDDAIVVAENISARHERGEDSTTAAVRGTGQVAWPVVATVLTTICAFLPLALIQGTIGDLLQALPWVVAIALIISLVEGLFILPSHMAHSLKAVDRRRQRGAESRLERIEHRIDGARDRVLYGKIVPFYVKSLKFLTRHRYGTVAGALAAVVISFGMVAGGRLEFIFFETSDAETINGNLRMPVGTPVEKTDAVMRRLEQAALAQPEVTSVYGVVGQQGDLEGRAVASAAPHIGQLILELAPVEARERTSEQVREAIREAVGDLSGVKSFNLEEVAGGPGGPPITFTVASDNPQQIPPVVEQVKRLLAEYDGVYDINDDADAGQRELRIELRPGATDLGFTVESLAQQLRGAVLGLEAYTFAGDREDVDVRVTLPESMRRSLADIEQMHVFSPRGDAVPLTEVAELSEAEAFATVRRVDRERAVTITAQVLRSVTNPDEVTRDLRPKIVALDRANPGVRILERGRQKDMQESFSTLPLGMGVAGVLIYVILTWLFGNWIQPLVVMAAIPFATIGMIWGHLLLGFSMTFLSLIGFVALSGVVVNDSLIFMEFFNEKRREGKPVYVAAVEAGRARFRAIMLTTITTVLGLLPLMLEQSFQARFLIPMAITISFGLMSATAIILVVLPCMLLILDDIKRGFAILWTGRLDAVDGHAAPGSPVAVITRPGDPMLDQHHDAPADHDTEAAD